jgi:hypothetical protein
LLLLVNVRKETSKTDKKLLDNNSVKKVKDRRGPVGGRALKSSNADNLQGSCMPPGL